MTVFLREDTDWMYVTSRVALLCIQELQSVRGDQDGKGERYQHEGHGVDSPSCLRGAYSRSYSASSGLLRCWRTGVSITLVIAANVSRWQPAGHGLGETRTLW